MDATDVEARIAAARVVPVLRLPDAAGAVRAAQTCFAAGLGVVELTTTTVGWADAVARLRADRPGGVIGVGTVLDAATARDALAVGADFLVSPCPAPAVRSIAGDALFIEGAMTVAEILDAGRHGLAKLFPAHVGGPQYLASILAVAPKLRIIPTGGIALDDVASWLNAGAFAVGVGRDFFTRSDPGAALVAALGPHPETPTER